MSLVLSKDELHAMTGYARPSDQEQWLKSNNIPFRFKGSGKELCVLRSWAENAPFYSTKLPPMASAGKIGGFNVSDINSGT